MNDHKKKALIVTTISGFVPQFEMKNVEILQEMGYEVHYATNYETPVYTDNNDRLNETDIVRHQVDFVRSPFRIISNCKAYRQLVHIMQVQNYDMVHCHTPMGGVIARLAARKTRTNNVIYTAHGFHFYKGAPLKNWVLFYLVERYLARYTDCLITMNEEDYTRAYKLPIRRENSVYKINGVGITIKPLEHVLEEDRDDFTLISVGEITKRKNHTVLLKAIKERRDPKLRLIICGTGALLKELQEMANKLEIAEQVEFKGYCTDIREQLCRADCFMFPSLQEGLPVALMEAMSMGLPVICSNIRGNRDLIQEKKGGYMVEPQDVKGYVHAIEKLQQSIQLRREMGEYNRQHIKEYDTSIVQQQMRNIYEAVLHE